MNRRRILAIDDNAANLRVMTELLAVDYSLSVALDGRSGFRIAKSLKPDLILLDVMMPGLDGFETCTLLKADEATREIPVIFITARDDRESELRGLDVGAVDYLQKPLLPAIAKARIRNHLELKLLRDSLEHEVEARTSELVVAEEATILGMALLAEYRDTDAGYHLKRTRMYVRILAEQLAARIPGILGASDIKAIVSSSVLHDIGKVAIPDAILFKPGPLNYDELHSMKKHPEFGAAVIDRMEAQIGPTPFLKYAREITSCHHERWDGSGYPLGLSGESVPLSAAIMAAADVYDALRSLRPYKKPISHEETCRIILEGDDRTRPEHFNPLVLDAFKAVSGQFRTVSEEFGDR